MQKSPQVQFCAPLIYITDAKFQEYTLILF